MKTAVLIVVVIVLLAVVGVGAFFAGNNYGMAQAQNVRAEFFNSRTGQGGVTGDPAQGQFGQGAQGGYRGQGGPAAQGGQGGQGGQAGQAGRIAATGTVKSVQGNTVTVTARDGSTVNVTLNAQTIIQKTSNGTASDILPGEAITVLSDQTGSNVTARTIQLRPAGQ